MFSLLRSSQTDSEESPSVPEPPDREIKPQSKKPKVEPSAPAKKQSSAKKKVPFRRGGVAYSKTPTRTSLDIVPRRRIYPVFVSNLGCQNLSHITYQVIQGKDHRLAQAITQLQLEYVLITAYNNRVVQTAVKHGYAFPEDASRLKSIASGLQLPDILARYIESIGIVTTASSAVIAPYCADYRQLYQVGTTLMRDPAAVLVEAGRQIPPGPWSLDIDWILQYNDATTRASRSGMKFRVITDTSFEGRNELLVSYMHTNDNMYVPYAPQKMTEVEAHLGACYSFRDYGRIDEWLGDNRELLFNAFTAVPLDPRITFSNACVQAFVGSKPSDN